MNFGHLFPPAASTFAHEVDSIYIGLTLASAVTMAILLGAIIGFAIRYRRGNAVRRTPRITQRRWWEYWWTGLSAVAFLVLFAWATSLYLQLFHEGKNPLEIRVIAAQWSWNFEHPGGQSESGELHIPVHRPIRLVMESRDVIHSFYVPAFRFKRDVVPGRYTRAYIEATATGKYPLRCAEYCGTAHSRMLGNVIVTSVADYKAWLKQAAASASGNVGKGKKLFHTLGCVGCHGKGAAVHAPDLTGLFGRKVTLSNGKTIQPDENYFRDSVLHPKKQIVKGFTPIMPSFEGQVNDAQIGALMAYVKSLGGGEQAQETQ